jgi:hypothetical protein
MAAGSGGHNHAGMQATKRPLTTWVPAWFLIGQAKTGISWLELSRHLGENVDTAWLLHVLHRAGSQGRRGLWVLKNP